MHRGRLDARHLACGQLDEIGLEAMMLGPAQVHAQQHVGPVLGLGAARARLDVQIGVIGIHLAGEHAPELELLEVGLEVFQLAAHLVDGIRVLFHLGQFEQITAVIQALLQSVDGADHHL